MRGLILSVTVAIAISYAALYGSGTQVQDETSGPLDCLPPQPRQAAAPEIVAEGIVSTHQFHEYGCTLSPDCQILYFTREPQGVERGVIMCSRLVNGAWSEPEPVSFAGVHHDHEPSLAPDGSKMFFGSTRPLPDGSRGYHIWIVERTPEGWGEPYPLGPPANAGFIMYVSPDRNGSLYTGVAEGIARIGYRNDQYSAPVPIEHPFSEHAERYPGHPALSPDGSYMLLDMSREGNGNRDLYVSFRLPEGGWSELINLGEGTNTDRTETCSRISPDGRYIYYSSERGSPGQLDLFRVSTAVLDELRP